MNEEEEGGIRTYEWTPPSQLNTRPWCPPVDCEQLQDSGKSFYLRNCKNKVYNPDDAHCMPTILSDPYNCKYDNINQPTCSSSNIPCDCLNCMLFDYPTCSKAYSNAERCPSFSRSQALGGATNGYLSCRQPEINVPNNQSCAVCNTCGGNNQPQSSFSI